MLINGNKIFDDQEVLYAQFSNASKMSIIIDGRVHRVWSWSVNASDCITGSILAQIEGSSCFDCYANKGHYNGNHVITPRRINLKSLDDLIIWEKEMINFISKKAKKAGHFRWFDSGDLQSKAQLISIVKIAVKCPDIKFWLPTQERKFLIGFIKMFGSFEKYPNLKITSSSRKIDEIQEIKILKENGVFFSFQSTSNKKGHVCPAIALKRGKCGPCTACWDKSIPLVNYPKH